MTGQKLNPPQIETSLPPIICGTNDIILTIPLYSNPAVANGDVKGLQLIIKNVSTGTIKEEPFVIFDTNKKFGENVTIRLDKNYIPGQYYKIQIAYIANDNNKTIGYYSSIGLSKCTFDPNVTIIKQENVNTNSFIGQYENNADPTEKVYSYCFTIFDGDEIADTSGIILHNINNDTKKSSSIDTWVSKKTLSQRKTYYVVYEITTINGLHKSSSKYVFKPQQESYIKADGEFIAVLHNEDGYISLHFKNLDGKFVMLDAGDYVITRSSSKDNFKHWIKLIDYILPQHTENVHFFDDYTIEQGVSYRYGLQLVRPSKNLTARKEALYYMSPSDEFNNICSLVLKTDFEDAFLSDGKRQLCIRYNPKVSSFKSTILESKVDTLGGKHPFIFRNGSVNYKEFSISGLIATSMDSNQHFMSHGNLTMQERFSTPGDLTQNTISSTDLTGDNFYKERDFKSEVLEWLTNGKPKLFRSPAEGNFIVRILNTSLSPNDTLGRMLHTFTCTAYEIADFNLENLLRHNLVRERIEILPKDIMIFNTVTLSGPNQYFISGSDDIRYLSFDGAHTDCFIKLKYSGDDEIQRFNVGNVTGTYSMHLPESPFALQEIEIEKYPSLLNITYGYYRKDVNISRNSSYTISDEVIIQQFLSNEPNEKTKKIVDVKDVIESIENQNTEINYCYFLRVIPKLIVNVAWNHDKNIWTYATQVNNSMVPGPIEVNFNTVDIYHDVCAIEESYSYFVAIEDESNLSSKTYTHLYLNGKPNYTLTLNNITYSFLGPQTIDSHLVNGKWLLSNKLQNLQDNNNQVLVVANDLNKPISINETITSGQFTSLKDVGELKMLKLGNGLMCDIVYEVYHYNI